MTTQTIVTHSGGFHADDVFAVATVLLSFPEGTEYSIVRSREVEVANSADVVVDVGGVYDPSLKRFDHHQRGGAGSHGNAIPYASFGLVWKEYGEKICGSTEIAKSIEEKIVMPIDALDNGVEISKSNFGGIRPFSISDYLYSYWIDDDSGDLGAQIIFEEVVLLAKNLLLRLIDNERRVAIEEAEVLKLYNEAVDKRVIVLPRSMACSRVLTSKAEPLYTIYPSAGGSRYQVKCVKVSCDSFEQRRPLPASWAGKVDSELASVTGVDDAVFCHNARFLVVTKSLDGALLLVRKALEE